VIGSVALAKVESSTSVAAPPATTATAAPGADPASGSEVHAAAVTACAAADTFRGAVGAVRQPYIDAAKTSADWNSPDFIALEGRYFGGVAAELSYVSSHTSPLTPRAIADAVGELRRAATELLDADIRRQPGEVSNQALASLRAADGAVRAACDAEGARK
jgi:hypothetical protein